MAKRDKAAATILNFHDVDFATKKDGFELYIALFKDESGNIYKWAPKWDDLTALFNDALLAEELNGGNAWVPFATTALRTLANILNSFVGKNLRLRPPSDNRTSILVQVEPKRKTVWR